MPFVTPESIRIIKMASRAKRLKFVRDLKNL